MPYQIQATIHFMKITSRAPRGRLLLYFMGNMPYAVLFGNIDSTTWENIK
jgi:hypothetical protein